MLSLEGRTAIITGGTGAQGEGIVRALAQGGMNVVMITHNREQASRIAASLGEAGARCLAMSNERGDDAVIEAVFERFGSVDVIIPNHGAPYQRQALEAVTDEDLSRKFEHQVVNSYRMIRKALPYLKQSRAGRIVLMASGGARSGFEEEGLCDNVARGGVVSLGLTLARELAADGVTVNCIAKSGLINDHPPKADGYDANAHVGLYPVGRLGTSDELGALVSWLASEEAGFVTGQVFEFSGGRRMG